MFKFIRKILGLEIINKEEVKIKVDKSSKLQEIKDCVDLQKRCIFDYELRFNKYMSGEDYRNSFGMLTGMKVHLTNLIAELDEYKELGYDLKKEEDFCEKKREEIEIYERIVEGNSNMKNPFAEPHGWKSN